MKKVVKRGVVSTVLWLARRLGGYRLALLFHEVRRRDQRYVDGLLEHVLNAELPARPFSEGFIRKYFEPTSAPRAILDLMVDDEVGVLLDAIPSETTPRERRLLWHFFSSLWDGVGDVVEIGPFLGGTSRAIALGMMSHPDKPDGTLLTFDRFQRYYTTDALRDMVEPLLSLGLISGRNLEGMGAESSFLSIFQEIHSAHPYGRRIAPIARPLPETADEAGHPVPWFALDEDLVCSAFFVDGCKSWYGTKYFMQECCRIAKPGSRFIFQDYLQHTCFWLPSFIGRFKKHFRLLCYVDHTYVFDLLGPLSPEEISDKFPDTAESWSADVFSELFGCIRAEAEVRGDRGAFLIHALQYGAALAYIGETDRARAFFEELAREPAAEGFGQLVSRAARVPTYRPNGSGGEPVRL